MGNGKKGERATDRQTERERERQRQTERKTDRQTDREREKGEGGGGEKVRKSDRQKKREQERQNIDMDQMRARDRHWYLERVLDRDTSRFHTRTAFCCSVFIIFFFSSSHLVSIFLFLQ